MTSRLQVQDIAEKEAEESRVEDLGAVGQCEVEIWGRPLRPLPEHHECETTARLGVAGENSLVYWCSRCSRILGPATY